MKIWKPLLTLAFCAVALCGCGRDAGPFTQEGCMEFLHNNMPVEDAFAYDESYWAENVAKTLEVREKMGWDVPEKEFLHFVLPVRVADEPLDRFRLEYADSVCEAVKGLSMYDAVLELNYWCLSHVNYNPDAQGNLSPLGVMAWKGAQCDGLTVFTVNVLRAAGIPARKVDVSWAHVGMGHSWTEVWVDGKWYFIGSVEPHVRLNAAWFNDPASRCYQTSVKVFGRYDGPEPVISRTDLGTTVNTIPLYTRNLRDASVTVVDSRNRPVPGATVDFMAYNAGSLFSLGKSVTGSDGRAVLRSVGCGSIIVFAFKDDSYGVCVEDGSESDIVMREHSDDPVHFATTALRIPPVDLMYEAPTDEQFEHVLERDAVCDSIRVSIAGSANPDSLARKAVRDACRPHIPRVDVPSTVGNVRLQPVVSGDIAMGRDFSFMAFCSDGLEPVRSIYVAPGRYLLVTGFRPDEDSVVLGLDVFTIPENVKTARIPVALRSDYRSR